MNTETRRVYAFIGAGLLTAAGVGVGVWRAGTPSTPSASDTATVTAEVSTFAEPAPVAATTPTSGTPATSVEAAAPPVTPPRIDDPFLAPHAIVQAVPSTITPTTVYRPENVRPAPADTPAEPTSLVDPAPPEPTAESTAPTAGQTPTPTVDTPAPGTPDQPDTPEPTPPVATPDRPQAPAAVPQQAPSETPEPADPVAPPVSTGADDAATTEIPEPSEPSEPSGLTEPAIEQAAVTENHPGWWIFGRWFPVSS